jgi:hypothetical protein
VEFDNLDSFWSLGELNDVSWSDTVVCVNDGLEGWHILDTSDKLGNVDPVADNSRNRTFVDGVNDGVKSESRIDSCNDERLAECAKCSNHPLRTCILKDGKTARSCDLCESRLIRSRNHTLLTKSSSKLVSKSTDFRKGPPGDTSKVLDLGALLAQELTDSHALAGAVTSKGILGQIVQSVDAFARVRK